MAYFEIRTMVEKAEVEFTPRISPEVAQYIWDYIYRNLLVGKKILIDDQFKYRITLDLKKFDPEKHKFFTDCPFNTTEDKFRPEPRFNKQRTLKFALLSVISTKIEPLMSPRIYADIIYDAFGSFLILISKKVKKEDFDELKKRMDYDKIESFLFPAVIEDMKLFIF